MAEGVIGWKAWMAGVSFELITVGGKVLQIMICADVASSWRETRRMQAGV